MKQEIKEQLRHLFVETFAEEPTQIEEFPANGSYREYCRMTSNHYVVIGSWNADLRENEAFVSFSKHFKAQGLPVPKIYAVNETGDCYLQSDLGCDTLYDFLTRTREVEGFSNSIVEAYRKVLVWLPILQTTAAEGIDFSKCYPRPAFDRQSMMWDLNYFKYYFLKLAKVPFDEQLLEDDFEQFTNYLLQTDTNFFLYRDFQSRNIMYNEGEVDFIDYQGGRKGALQYDLASLLYDAKANIPQAVRGELLEFYLDELEKIQAVNRTEFKSYFAGYVLIRIMQAMGAYGFRGFYEKKEHFLKSIPFALDNMSYILDNFDLPVQLPELMRVLRSLIASEELRAIGEEKPKLTVRIGSFSYKKGLPQDPSGNGGGFIFDCRAIHNPGRYEPYKQLTGRDAEVVEFLENKSEMPQFMSHVYALVSQSVETYINRGFTSLTVNFGCTGGQHRSVYGAEQLARFLSNNYKVEVVLTHREQHF
ncbi:MAG: phosphotransferase [Mangrovibacterium sp.]